MWITTVLVIHEEYRAKHSRRLCDGDRCLRFMTPAAGATDDLSVTAGVDHAIANAQVQRQQGQVGEARRHENHPTRRSSSAPREPLQRRLRARPRCFVPARLEDRTDQALDAESRDARRTSSTRLNIAELTCLPDVPA
jgi:hypothetical protein